MYQERETFFSQISNMIFGTGAQIFLKSLLLQRSKIFLCLYQC